MPHYRPVAEAAGFPIPLEVTGAGVRSPVSVTIPFPISHAPSVPIHVAVAVRSTSPVVIHFQLDAAVCPVVTVGFAVDIPIPYGHVESIWKPKRSESL